MKGKHSSPKVSLSELMKLIAKQNQRGEHQTFNQSRLFVSPGADLLRVKKISAELVFDN